MMMMRTRGEDMGTEFATSHKFHPPIGKKPTRPPPPPPIESPSSHHHDYIKISECSSGLPDHRASKPPPSFKNRSSTSFSSTLKPSTSLYIHSSYHHKSRSLTNDPHPITYYSSLELPSRKPSREPTSVVYTDINNDKTEALTMCKAKRDSRLHQ